LSRRRRQRPGRYLSVVGARPQFIKLAPLHAALSKAGQHLILHTGQHYDDAMSARFFRELGLPKPDINLGVKGGGHAVPTGKMLIGLARAFERLQPDWILVYGDTTSTLAGALAGAQAGIPVAHVEAGLRSFLPTQPEERNRVVADHLATLLFCPTATAVRNLKREGIREGVFRVGDPMAEALAWHWRTASSRALLEPPGAYYFCTVHRAENTDLVDRLRRLIVLLDTLDRTVIFPIHPRTAGAFRKAGLLPRLKNLKNVRLYHPFGYLDTLRHIASARAVLTDSGGVQREAAWLGTLCLTLRPVTEWVETVERGQNKLVDLHPQKVAMALASRRPTRRHPGTAPQVAERIVAHLRDTLAP
jgi:UDP-N-acetylglucosamine 2-epimerase